MEKIDEQRLANFCQRFREFLSDVEARKKRGQNDFNPLLCVQNQDDEANMHSGFLYGLLNPKGEHYQDDLFLKLFLDSVGLKGWFGDTRGAEVHKEWVGDKKNGRADLYITNHHRHIIVENKIWAGDQERQIERYIENLIKSESSADSALDSRLDSDVESDVDSVDSGVACEDVAVIYLTPRGKEPSESSLGKWHIVGECLVDKNNERNKVRYLQISYKEDILKWLESCLKEIGGISNLRSAIECYEDVVKRVTGQRENTMGIDKFLTREGKLKENMEIVLELFKHKETILETYCEVFIESHRDEIEENGFEIVEYRAGEKWGRVELYYPYVLKPKDCGEYYLAFCIENYITSTPQEQRNAGYGVRIFGKPEKNKYYSKAMKSCVHNDDYWWYERDHAYMIGVESKLQEFLHSTKIKSLNEKLKSFKEE